MAIEERFMPVPSQNALPNNSITAIESDDFGFIWIGTEYGLARFDGYSFYSFFQRNDEKNEIPSNQIKEIIKTTDHAIWVACNKGLAKIDPATIQITQPLCAQEELQKRIINTIHEDGFKNIWIGTDMGVYVYSLQTGDFREVDIVLGGKQRVNVNFINLDPEKNIWIASNAGYAKVLSSSCKTLFTKKDIEIYKYPRNQHVSSFGIDKWGILWSNDGNLFFCYDLINDPGLQKPHTVANNIDGKTIFFPEEGDLFVGTRWHGCLMVNYNYFKNQFMLQKYWMGNSSMVNMSNTVNVFCKDKWGSIWAGTKEGLFLLQRKHQTPFYNIQERSEDSNTPSHQGISCYTQTEDGKIWIGANNGLNVFEWVDRRTNHYKITRYSKPDLESNGDIIQCMTQLGEQTLFMGTKNGTISFDIQTKTYNKDSYLNHYLQVNNKKVCKTICKDAGQILWLGFADDGALLAYDLTTKNIVDIASFKGKDVWSVVRYADRIWVGTRSGLYSFQYKNNRPEEQKNYFKKNDDSHSLPDEWVTSLFVDRNNRLWVGTANGLCYYDPEEDRFHNIQFDLNNDVAYICGIIEDRDNNIWASSIKGIYKIDHSQHSTFFELSNGRFSTMNYAFGSLLAQDGTIFLGGVNGLTYFNPEEVIQDTTILPVYFSDIIVNGNSMLENLDLVHKKAILLKYNQNQILINFSSLYYPNPNHIKYYYRLAGYDSNWLYSDHRNYASFSNLPPGKYVFEVRSTNLLGFTHNNTNKLEIEILPPLWKTWWAYLIYSLAVMGIIFAVYRSLIERNRLLQEEKNNLWRFQLYTNISHGFKAPLLLMENPLQRLLKEGKELPEKEKNELLLILQRNTKRLTHLINQLMEFRRIDRGRSILHLVEADLLQLLKDVYTSFLPLSESKKIKFEFQSEEEPMMLVFDYEKIETVLFNLFSNALKFTEQGGTITLSLTKDSANNCVWVSLQDSGIGISSQHIGKIFERFWQEKNNQDSHVRGTGIGLSLAKEFVELHHGKMTVQSELGKGSTFRFSLPAGKEHFKGQPIGIFNQEQKVDGSYTSHFVEIEKGLTFAEGYYNVNREDNRQLIFVIEDDTEVRHYLQSELIKDYSVRTFANSQNVFSEIVRSNPDLVISDVMINGEEQGFRLCKLIKKDIVTSHIPVVLLTGLSSEHDKISGYEVGADAYIEKPFDVGVLKVRIKQLLSNREKFREKVKMDIIVNPKEVSATSIDEKFLTNAMKVIEEYMDDADFSIEDFAREMGMSKTFLNNKLQALTGQSTNEFVRTVRLNRAAKLLLTDAYNISEIGYMVGFSSPKYFSTSFKKYFNMTPKEYIEKNGKKQ